MFRRRQHQDPIIAGIEYHSQAKVNQDAYVGETCEMRRAREYGIEEVPYQNRPHDPEHPLNKKAATPNTVDHVLKTTPYPGVTITTTTPSDPTAHWSATSNTRPESVPSTGQKRDRALKIARLAAALTDASAAHHTYEVEVNDRLRSHGMPADWTDANWATWYARHMVDMGFSVE